MELTGADILLECLKREGVDVVFGFPGGAVIDIYDAIPRYSLRHVLVRHEQGAVHAADGYARASGKVGVALVTSGPGATNTVTGIANAYCDSIPMVVITGQVPTPLIGNDAFQEVDIVGITRPCTKHNYLVKDVDQLATVIRQAFYLARSGRPGPVLVDLPKDVVQAKTKFVYPKSVKMRSYNPTIKPNKLQLKKAVDMFLDAKRPLFYVGGGVISSNGSEELSWLARNLNIPVTATLMGLGAFPGDDPLFLGMLGMHGTYAANMGINNCDVMIAVGARFDDRVTGKLDAFAPEAKIVHVDIDPTSIRKNVRVDVPVVSDCLEALKGFKELAQARLDEKDWKKVHQPWVDQVQGWKVEHPLTYKIDPECNKDSGDGKIKPQFVVETIYELSKGDAIIATEVGQNQMWAAQFYHYNKPRTLLTSGGLGTMGYGFPAAIGAQLAFPDKLVVDIAGDGSIQMNIQELITAVCNDLPVKIVILNNTYLGMVRQWQELFYARNYCATCMDAQPDFVALAKAYGAEGYRITEPEDVKPVLQEAFALPKACIIDVRVTKEENVYPMVPAGASLTEMLLV
ncbi:biosynthetic-type acetolactate synthase large subunit [Oceanidesulfovibrio marinus]|uniref:Acetolactate synthase n=1 Tax=Oceanidesulfovibrio marinus TaxID=370038 RepID=A0A6P1ZJL3_9BACT|nr:biosynthetic-type acetolactate synthase large subunit [Oceanidesulfovibrio marinus]QJT07889.1 biosynthetic-type acetolactate synthase large subunit [Oceanidesulfovibrio marinus]TVM33389.1 biosynthetic-type acetolactate synthase large subunit [Oceanidesulfovibrio marinus]